RRRGIKRASIREDEPVLNRLAAVAALLLVPTLTALPAYAAPPSASEAALDDTDTEDEYAANGAEAGRTQGDVGTFGYAVGVDPLNSWQFSNAFFIRHSPWGDWSEAILGVNTRSQVI